MRRMIWRSPSAGTRGARPSNCAKSGASRRSETRNRSSLSSSRSRQGGWCAAPERKPRERPSPQPSRASSATWTERTPRDSTTTKATTLCRAAPFSRAAVSEASSAAAAAAGGEAMETEETGGAAEPMETEAAPKEEEKPKAEEKKAKKKIKKTDLPIASVMGGMGPTELEQAVEKEFNLALQDRVMEETKDRKNAVEEYVYSMRNKLFDVLEPYVTEDARAELSAKLEATEDWLYEDGEDESKGVYIAKLEELHALGEPIALRFKESEARGPAASALKSTCEKYQAQIGSPACEHIEEEEKEKVLKETGAALAWLAEKIGMQEAAPKTQPPVVLSSEIVKKEEMIERFCRPIVSKPKPKPPPPPKEEPKPEEAKPEAAPAPDADGAAPMETEAPPPAGAADLD
mmetsp:Transcript_2600/g.9505  ORF Transcript_2600/g.9505 Transcript_2600/m.9505 type:complete len:404 (-) Transcript_2600:150-1361(-)